MKEQERVVRDFIEAWNQISFDEVISHLGEDIYYHNIPMEPVSGLPAVTEYLKSAWIFSECNWQILNIVADGDIVLTERIDDFVINGSDVSLPVMGTFELKDLKIEVWRDYFDLSSYQRQLTQAGL